jgi:hypothetical protein
MIPTMIKTADLKREAFKQRVLARPVGWLSAAIRIGQTAVWTGLDLVIRLWLAQVFFVSGLLKAADWDNALYLAANEYPVSWLDPCLPHGSAWRSSSGAPSCLRSGWARVPLRPRCCSCRW